MVKRVKGVPLWACCLLVLFIAFSGWKIIFLYAHKAIDNHDASRAGYKRPKYLEGSEWRKIDALPLSQREKEEIKASLIRLVLESYRFIDQPLTLKRASLLEYVHLVDDFYAPDENSHFPLHVALRLIARYDDGAPIRDDKHER
jgi:hypothetical protein